MISEINDAQQAACGMHTNCFTVAFRKTTKTSRNIATGSMIKLK